MSHFLQKLSLVSLIPLALLAILFSLMSGDATINSQIIFDLRLPRTLNAFTTGGLLALAGALMQVLLRNPLADPYILGVSGGAAVGALSCILLGLSGINIMLAAFLGALFSIALVFGLSRNYKTWSNIRLLLTGIVVASGWGAVISFILLISPDRNLHSLLFWLMGSLTYHQLALPEIIILSIGLIASLLLAPQLNILVQGELVAASLGVNPQRLQLLLFILASLLTASAVSIAGSIGFVGLVIPHVIRLLGIRDHRLLLPMAMLLGGIVLTLADSFARTLFAPIQLPVGIITAFLGIPLFLILLNYSSRYAK